MKKAMIFFLIATLVLSCAACGGGGGSGTAAETTTAAAAVATTTKAAAATTTAAAAAETTKAAAAATTTAAATTKAAAAATTTAAAAATTAGAAAGPATVLSITLPGDPSLDWDMVRAVIAERCQADGLNIDLKAIFIPFSDLTQRNQLMMNAGEKIDLMFDAPFASLSQNIAAGFYEPLDGLLAQYGPNILSTRGEFIMEFNKFNNIIYAIPMAFYLKSGNQLFIRKDIRLAAGVENPPKSWDEAIDMAYKIKAAFPDKPVIGGAADNYRFVRIKSYELSIMGVRDYIPDFYLDPGCTVIKHPVIEKENGSMWPLYQLARQLYLDGIIDPDALSVNSIIESFASGKVSVIQTVDFGINLKTFEPLAAAVPEAQFENVSFQSPDRPGEVYNHFRTWNFQTVPIYSENKELAIRFLDWGNASQANYDLLTFGIEGVHYELEGESNVTLSTAYDGRGYAWTWNPTLGRLPATIPDWQIPLAKAYLNQDYFAVSAFAGFNADFEPITNEWAQHQAIYAKYSVLEHGFMDPAQALEEWASEDMANITAICDELNRQLSSYLESKGTPICGASCGHALTASRMPSHLR